MYLLSCAVPQKGFSNIAQDGFVLNFPGQLHVTSLSVIKFHTYTNAQCFILCYCHYLVTGYNGIGIIWLIIIPESQQ